MDKKGVDTRTVLWTFYILLVLIISYVLYTFIEDSASGKALKEKYFINDLGLNFDFLPSLNHDLEIKYNIEVAKDGQPYNSAFFIVKVI